MALFRCASGGGGGGQITVTYDSDFYGETITCTRGQKVYSKVASSSGSVVFVVNEEGDWLIECTMGGDTYSTTASVEFTASAELVAIPDGETVTPTDDVEIWLLCAGIRDKSYTTLSEVLDDSETFNALLGDSNACAYMARSTTFASTLCADQYAMSMIGQYDVCCDALLGNTTWASAIVASAYADYVITTKVPTMTSNTTPSGTAFASSEYSASYPAWKAFDNNTSTFWGSTVADAIGSTIGYEFTSSVVISAVKIVDYGGTNRPTNVTIQGYDTEWHDIKTFDRDTQTTFDSIQNTTPYTKYRVKTNAISGTVGTHNPAIEILQFYGRTPSNELIHGTNNESAYYLDGASETPIVDPSTLSAGTYTFGSTVAKDPSDLTDDYTKTIRITPNTKEIVLRPDNSLYWYGYEGAEGIASPYRCSGYQNWNMLAPTITKNTNSMAVANSGQGSVIWNDIDLSNASIVNALCQITSGDNAASTFAIATTSAITSDQFGWTDAKSVQTTEQIMSLDASSINNSRAISFTMGFTTLTLKALFIE